MIHKTLLGLAMSLALSAHADTEVHETIELELAAGGFEAETLVLENFPVDATETIYTEQGSQALVTRFEDRFEIELHGETITVPTPDRQRWAMHHGEQDVVLMDVDERMLGEDGGEQQRVMVVKRVGDTEMSDEELEEMLKEKLHQHEMHHESEGQEHVERHHVVIKKKVEVEG